MRTTLEQWRMFRAVVEHGGYAQAADAIHKSQSTISYGVHKLQEQLGVQLLEVEGRRAVLTNHGQLLLQKAERLLDQAESLDEVAQTLSSGTEPLIRLARDMIYPCEMLFDVLEQFSTDFPHTHIELNEFVLSGGTDMLDDNTVDLLITPIVPPDREGHFIHRATFIPVSHPDHPLQQLERTVTFEDLTGFRQVVLRDSGRKRSMNTGWLGAEQRWTVSHITTSLNILRRKLGFAWLPENWVREDLEEGRLKEIPLDNEARRYGDLYILMANPESAGPATRALYDAILNQVGTENG